MTDMSPEARRLLGLARRGDDLREIDRARLTQRVAQRLTLAAGVAGMTLAGAKAASGAGVALLLGKGAAVGVLLAATTFGVWKAAEQVSSSHSVVRAGSAALMRERALPQRAVTSEGALSHVAVSEHRLPRVAVNEHAADRGAPDGEVTATRTGPGASIARITPRGDASKDDVLRTGVVVAPHQPKQIIEKSDALALSTSVADPDVSNASSLDASSRSGATDPLQDEVSAFRTVQQSMAAGDARRALSLVTEQNHRFSTGALQQERAAARVFALCTLGRNSEARSEARAFEQRWPRSPMLARVRRACETELPK